MITALILTVVGCNSTDSLAPDSGSPVPGDQPAFASVSFAGGIPFGISAMPTSAYGSRYNGALENIWPNYLLSELAAIKAAGGKAALMFAGNEKYYKDANGHFSLSLWKQRIDRFKGVDFSAYVNDGTIIGHYMIDEPNDPANWNGEPVTPATLDQMGQYSKQLWPNMPTIVRTEPRYFTSSPKYVDAAWAQYLFRRGDVNDYIKRNVTEAQDRGLALIVGLNLLKGGDPNGTPMTPSEVQTFGSALLSSSYPCAFISWMWDATYLSTSGINSAMDQLRSKAQNRSVRGCRGSTDTPTTSEPAPTPAPAPTPTPTPMPGAGATLPFGLSLAPTSEYSGEWTSTVYRASPSGLVARLDQGEAAGMKLVVSLAAPAATRNADGTFSLAKWKTVVDQYRSLSLAGYVSDQALYLHLLVEQPNCKSCWGGTAIPWETVEEMARYSKSIWPGLATAVRVPPTTLAGASFTWTYLDAGWAQYNTKFGDPASYLAKQVAAAGAEGLGLVAGLNLAEAGGANTAPMTASQIKQFGTILASDPSVCALVGWRYDSGYLSQTGIRQALDSVATVARSRGSVPCAVS
jgi:hypothetical protein